MLAATAATFALEPQCAHHELLAIRAISQAFLAFL